MNPKLSFSVFSLFVIFFILSSLSLASNSIFRLNFNIQDLSFEKVKGYDRVKLLDGRFSAEPGAPLLPLKFAQIAIPSDSEVEKVKVLSFESQELSGIYNIYPAQNFYPLSEFPTKNEKIEFVEPNPLIYDLSSEYPGKLAQVTNNGFLGGQHIAGVALYPVQYIPSEGKLILYTQIEFELIFKPTSHFATPVNRRSTRGAKFYSDLARSIVINPEEVSHEPRGYLPLEEEVVDYLIITDDSLISTFQELADWKIQKGISTRIREVSWVLSNYDGYDEGEKIRNCIRDYYSNHGTRWVLLGGDTPILPHRVAPVMGENIPCDLYYSDLDSNWDGNGNHIYGEYEDSVDMYPDVFVGRAPCSDISQAETFVNKCLTYERDPPIDYQRRILYAAEVLWAGTDGAELKNYIDAVFVPDYFEGTKLYYSSGNLSRTTFGDSLNYGQNIINHSGHGNSDRISIGADSWTSSDMDNLTNAPRYSLFYTFGCITAAIDMDCIGEHFINNPNGGGFAYCGNTRYGWGIIGAPLEGPGPEFDMEFFSAIFDSSTYQVGKTLGNSKIPFIPISSQQWNHGPYYRWTMFTLLLLGDPTLELWTDSPNELWVSHEPVFFAGLNYFEVSVTEDSSLICCVKDGEILGTAYSSGGGATVYFDSPVITFGSMQVTVTKHDYMPYHNSVLVIPPEGPYVIYHSHGIDDSGGNNNGVVNPDETINMSITIKNIGINTGYGVTAILREEDDYITVIDSAKSFGDIDSGMTAQSLSDYVVEVDASCPDSHWVEFTLEATDGDSLWVTKFFQIVVEPDFLIFAHPDTALMHKEDSTRIELVFKSVGGFNWQIDLSHTPLPPEVSGFLDPDQLVPTDSSIFRIYGTPDAYPGIYPITVTASGGEISRQKEVVLGIIAEPYSGPVWHVSTQGYDLVGNGSEEFPIGTIQKGIDSAVDGDTVLVSAGTYYQHFNYKGKGVLVTSTSGAESTVICKLNPGIPIVTFNSGEDSTSILGGFTIQNADNPGGYGGAIACHDHSSPVIRYNILKDNVANQGAGIDIRVYSSPHIEYNQIIRDSATSSGGGISCYDHCAPTIVHNRFVGNSAYYMGGAIRCSIDCFPTISYNLFIENSAGNDGGAIYVRENSAPAISHNLMARNNAGKAGGAIYCFDNSPAFIVSNTIDGNSTNEWGGSITCAGTSSPQIVNTIISNEHSGYGIHADINSFPVITYSDIWNNALGDFSRCEPGRGCISADPMFIDPETDNYYLQPTSPCLGTGENGVDIGAFSSLMERYVIYHSHQIDDSGGNNNGAVNPDETIVMSVTVKNIGIETAYGVSATLSVEDSYIVVMESVKYFGNIDWGMTAQSLGDYVFEVDSLCPDSHWIEFTLEATDGEKIWISRFFQLVLKPNFLIHAIPDTAITYQGDSTLITLVLEPVGGFNSEVDLTLSELPAELSGFLNPEQITPPGNSFLRIYTTPEVCFGTHSITLNITGGSITCKKELILGIIAPPYYGPVWYVSTEGHDIIGNGSEEYPFGTIQKGIDSAEDGDTVLVAAGSYCEHLDFKGKGILVASEAGAESTSIDKTQDGVPIVVFNSGEDSSSILDGFIIQNANNPDGNGGGIACHDSSSPTIRNNILKHNLASRGAGIDIQTYSSPLIINNQIFGDSAANSGGGISCYNNCSPIIIQNLFFGNKAFWMGGAIHCRLDCFPKIIQNVFLENNAGNDGGAIYCCQGSSPEISQNVIARNTADKAGGAIYCYDFASPVIVSNTLDRNASNQWGGSITCHTSSSPQILNTIISNESSGYGIHAETGSYPGVTYCDVWNNPKGDYSGCEPGDGCMSKDPMFCDPEGDNYWLHIVSLCLGAGEGGTDIGAYGLGCGSGDANGDGKVGISDAVYLVNYLFRNGPPPDPVENGDVNCDDRVSVEDVIYLINYLFKGGSPPC